MKALFLLLGLAFAQQTEESSGVAVAKIAKPRKELRFTVTVPAPLSDVWTAFSTTDGLKTWLWSDARVDLRAGGDWLVLYPGGKTGGGTINRSTRRPEFGQTTAKNRPHNVPGIVI